MTTEEERKTICEIIAREGTYLTESFCIEMPDPEKPSEHIPQPTLGLVGAFDGEQVTPDELINFMNGAARSLLQISNTYYKWYVFGINRVIEGLKERMKDSEQVRGLNELIDAALQKTPSKVDSIYE